MRKILPNIRNKNIWEKIDNELLDLTNNKTMAPVRDFWNLVDTLCFGLKLKNLVPRLTSQNIKWTKEKLKLDNIYMGSKNDFKCLRKLDIDMPNGKEIKSFLFDKKNYNILKFAKKDSLLNSKKTFDRDKYLIITGKKNNKIVVYDGNRRMIKNILDGNDKILTYTARAIKQPMFYNYWVPTSHMANLVVNAIMYIKNNDKKTAKSLCQALGHLIKFSEVGKNEFYERVINNPSLTENKFVLNEVEKIINYKIKSKK